MRRRLNKLAWMKRVTLKPSMTPLAYWQLGRGETEVIEYTRRHEGSLALLDDKDARRTASALNIPVIGTLGIVARSASTSGIDSFNEMIQRLQDAGIYLDRRIISDVRKGLRKR